MRADPDEGKRIFCQGLESLELEISLESESYSVGIGDRILSRGQHPLRGQATPTWRTGASGMHKHQDERSHEETGTADGVEKLEPAAAESWRTYLSRQRTSGRARRQRRGKGWTAWTGLKDTRTVGQGEWKNRNRWRRGQGTRRRKLEGQKERSEPNQKIQT